MPRASQVLVAIAAALAPGNLTVRADEPVDVLRGVGLDRTGTRSSAGIELSWSADSAPGSAGARAARLDLFGQVVFSRGLGGYAVVPLLWGDPGGDAGAESGAGNAELGALYLARSSPSVQWLLRAGSTLPFVADSDVILLATANRLADLVHVRGPDATARISASPVLLAGDWMARADLGLDLVYARLGDGDRRHTVLRAGLGVGRSLGAVAAWVEAVSLVDDEERTGDGFSIGAGWQHAFSAAIRLRRFPVQQVVGVTVAIVDYGPDQPSPVYVLALGSEIVPPPGWIRRPAPNRR